MSVGSKVALAALPPAAAPLALAVFVLPELWMLWQLFAPNASGLGPLVRACPAAGGQVVLTIDDGPDPATTPALLDLLGAHGAKAVFFVVGEKVRAHPGLARAIADHGHELGNHTDRHAAGAFWCFAPSRIAREIDRCADAVEAAAGVRPRFFRAPAGIKNPALFVQLEARGLAYLGWSARGRDAVSPEPARPIGRLLRGLRPGAVLLTHESGRNAPVRLAVVTGLLREMERRGLRAALPPAPPARPRSAAGRSAPSLPAPAAD
ncbi:MAG TPA: polysaccharide deacetylase family protein [Opitutaceae bacterium]|nr:polysaccharide deacetylase family protein [Opitutaceae bacterium]